MENKFKKTEIKDEQLTQTKTKIEYISTNEFLKETAISMKKNKKAFKELAK